MAWKKSYKLKTLFVVILIISIMICIYSLLERDRDDGHHQNLKRDQLLYTHYQNTQSDEKSLKDHHQSAAPISVHSHTGIHNQYQGISERDQNRIKAFASSVLSCKGVPGMTIGVFKDNYHWTLPLGVRDLDSSSPVTSKTKFFIGSVTKTFTAQLAALMVQDSGGQLSWDDPVAKILGSDFRMSTAELGEITLRDLLSHRSGLVSGNLAVRASLPRNITRADLVRLFYHVPVNSQPATNFLYSNIGYALAGAVLEKWWKQPWEELIQKRLLRPLGMSSSSVVKSAKDMIAEDFSKPYVPVDGNILDCDPEVYQLGPFTVAGSLASSSEDMTKWMEFVLRQGKSSGENGAEKDQLIGQRLMADMWESNINLSSDFKARTEKNQNRGWPEDDFSEGYGMGWFLNKYRGLNKYWHGGGLYSYYSMVWLLPQANMGLFISISGYRGCTDTKESHPAITRSKANPFFSHVHSTQDSGDANNPCLCGSSGFSVVESLAYFITDILLGHEPWISDTRGCTYPHPWVKCDIAGRDKFPSKESVAKQEHGKYNDQTSAFESVHSQNESQYTGVFHNDLLGNAHIFLKQQSAKLYFQFRLLSGTLVLKNASSSASITFGLECDGKYRFLSKPDNFTNVPAKLTFTLVFHKQPTDVVDTLSLYYSPDEVPFVFHKL